MAHPAAVSARSPKGRKGLRVLAIALAALLVLVLVVYFVLTSSAFFKGVILPRAGKALNAQITVSEASVSPFRHVFLKGLKVQTTGSEPLLVADELRIRYSLADILGGTLSVDELTAVAPTLVITQDASGRSNLDPILDSMESDSDTTTEGKKDEALKLDVSGVRIERGNIRYIRLNEDGTRAVTQLNDLNLALSNLGNGESGKLTLSSGVELQQNAGLAADGGSARAQLAGEILFALSPQLELVSAKGGIELAVLEAAGAFQQASGLQAELTTDLSPTEITELALRFSREKVPLAQLRAAGPLNMLKKEGRLKVELTGLDKQLLNIVGAPMGLDFGPSRISSTNHIALAQGGQLITASGELMVNSFQVTRTNQATPPLDLRASYESTINMAQSNAVLSNFVLTGTQNGTPLLQGNLSTPFHFNWAGTQDGIGDSTLAFKLIELNLADWKPFLGEVAPAGRLSGDLELRSQGAGDRVAFSLRSQGTNLTITAGTDIVSEAGLNLQVAGALTNREVVHLQSLNFGFSQRAQPVLLADVQGLYTLSSRTGVFQLRGQAAVPTATRIVPMDADFTSGRAELNAKINLTGDARDIAGGLLVTNLTGRFGSNSFQAYALAGDFQVGLSADEVSVRKLSTTLGAGGRAGGQIHLNGTYNLSNSVATLTAKLTQLNQQGLRPFLDPMMTEMKVLFIELNGDANVQYRPEGASVFQTTMSVSNLVLADIEKQITPAPLEFRLTADAALEKDIADLRRLEVLLPPTPKVKNNLAVFTGRIDLSQADAIQGTLGGKTEGLDITRYYDVYMGDAPPEVQDDSGVDHFAGVPPPPEEFEPLILPLKNFLIDVEVGTLWLREVQMKKLQAQLKMDGGVVSMPPVEFTLNDAPARTGLQLDMGVPGWKYDFEFNTKQAPVPPLVDSFLPEQRGQVGGSLDAALRVAGQGISDASIQKNLTGFFDIATTNLNIAIPTLQNPLLKTVVNVIAIIPDLLKNPKNPVGSIAGAIFGAGQGQSESGGFSDELTQSPIDVIQARGTMKPGMIELEHSLLQSSAFRAGASGKVDVQPVLTNSPIVMPLDVSLRRSLAEKISMVPAGTPTNAAYVKLPHYVTIRGTVGEPKSDINYAALVGTALQQLGGRIPGVDEKTSGIIQSLGGILSNRSAAGTNAPATTTNAPAQGRGVLGGLERLLGPQPASTNTTGTNTPAGTNAPAATNSSPAGTLLDQLLRPRKQ